MVEKRGKKHQTQQQIFVRCSWLGLSERFVVLSDLLNEHHRVAPLVESLAQNLYSTQSPGRRVSEIALWLLKKSTFLKTAGIWGAPTAN